VSVRKTRNVGGGGVGIIISENPLLPPLPLCVCVCVCVCACVRESKDDKSEALFGINAERNQD